MECVLQGERSIADAVFHKGDSTCVEPDILDYVCSSGCTEDTLKRAPHMRLLKIKATFKS